MLPLNRTANVVTGIVIQVFYDSYDVGIDAVFAHDSIHKDSFKKN